MAVDDYPKVHEGVSSERSVMARVGVIGGALLVGLALYVAANSKTPNQGFTEAGAIDGGAASVLAMVSIVAVGIERFIEMFWSLMASFKNGWWPLPEIAKAVDTLAEETNQVAKPAFAAAIAGIEEAQKAVADGSAEFDRLKAEIDKVRDEEKKYKAQIKAISSLAKDNQRVQLVATTAFQAAHRLDTAYGTLMPAVRQAFNDVSQVTAGVSDVLAGFKENPAKKIISIYVGSMVGLVVSGFVGLDLFAAAGLPLGESKFLGVPLPYVGVMLTGLVVGLGANPTHEVVRLVSEAAKSRRASNMGRPNVSGSPDERDERAGAAGAAGGAAAGTSIVSILERLLPTAGSTAPTQERAQPGTMNLR